MNKIRLFIFNLVVEETGWNFSNKLDVNNQTWWLFYMHIRPFIAVFACYNIPATDIKSVSFFENNVKTLCQEIWSWKLTLQCFLGSLYSNSAAVVAYKMSGGINAINHTKHLLISHRNWDIISLWEFQDTVERRLIPNSQDRLSWEWN